MGDQAVSLPSPALAQGLDMSIFFSPIKFLSVNLTNQISKYLIPIKVTQLY